MFSIEPMSPEEDEEPEDPDEEDGLLGRGAAATAVAKAKTARKV